LNVPVKFIIHNLSPLHLFRPSNLGLQILPFKTDLPTKFRQHVAPLISATHPRY